MMLVLVLKDFSVYNDSNLKGLSNKGAMLSLCTAHYYCKVIIVSTNTPEMACCTIFAGRFVVGLCSRVKALT